MTKITSKKVELDYPFEYDGRQIDSLTLRRMRAGDAMVGEETKDSAEAGFLLLARLADVDVELIKLMDLEDFELAQEAMASLMGKSAREAMEAAKKKALSQ